LDFFETRYYSAPQGRFSSPDSYNIVLEKEKGVDEAERREILFTYLAQPQLWNKYAYTLNNPLKHTDPDGRRALTDEGWRRLQALANEQQAAVMDKDTELADAIGNAMLDIVDAIDAVPEGQADPANLKAVFYAIDHIGDSNFGRWGTLEGTGGMAGVGFGDYKCNYLPAYAYGVGAGIGFGGESGYPVRGLPAMKSPPPANVLGGRSARISNFPAVFAPGLGDVAAFPSFGRASGHTAMYLGSGVLIYAGEYGVKVNTLGQTSHALHTAFVTYRRYKP
jgi:RHS repeat-associated protein